jgi:tetratricopeptide (TPR) repeat protein
MFKQKSVILILLVLSLMISLSAQNQDSEIERMYLKGRSLSFDRKFAEAIDTLKAVYTLDPEHRRAILLLGDVFLKIGNLNGAEQAFQQLIDLDSHKPFGYLKLAELYWHEGRYTTGLEYLRTASLLTDPPVVGFYNWKGQILRSMAKLEESDSIFRDGLKSYPANPELLANYATTLIHIDDTAKAGKYIDSAFTLDSNSVFVVNTMVSYRMFINDIAGASMALERATQLDPDDPYTRSNIVTYSNIYRNTMARKHFMDGNQNYYNKLYRKAKEDYLNAIKSDSMFFEVHLNLGFTYIHLGEPHNAAASFEKALKLKSDYARGYVGWGDALISMNEPEAALEKYKKAAELAPDNIDYQNLYLDMKKLITSMEKKQ